MLYVSFVYIDSYIDYNEFVLNSDYDDQSTDITFLADFILEHFPTVNILS